MFNKIQELKKIGFYEISDSYIQENMPKCAIKKARDEGKKFILARKFNDIVIFYTESYIRSKTIEELKNKPGWLDLF